jgi:hypothetical protein
MAGIADRREPDDAQVGGRVAEGQVHAEGLLFARRPHADAAQWYTIDPGAPASADGSPSASRVSGSNSFGSRRLIEK